MKENSLKVKKLVGMASLTTLVIVLQLLGNFIPNFANNLALALIPMAVGAILYGPLAGLFLGVVMGVVVAANPANYSMVANRGLDVFKLIVVIFVKSPVAGYLAGVTYKGLAHFAKKAEEGKKRNFMFFISVFASSMVVPIVNTGMYAVLMLILFGLLGSAEGFNLTALTNNIEAMGQSYNSTVAVVFLGFIGVNFFIEAGIAILTSPAVVTILKAVTRNYDLGFKNDFPKFHDDEVVNELEEESLELEKVNL